jgi:acyl-CoA thioesterase I
MRIVVLGDSMPMPRVEGIDCVWWEQTWPYLLQEHLISHGFNDEVINCSSRSRTVDSLCGEDFNEHIIFKRPDVLILELGVVDCAPRIFSKKEKKILNSYPIPGRLRDWIIKWRTAHRKEIIRRNPLKKIYTPPNRFVKYLYDFSGKLSLVKNEARLIVLPIIADYASMEIKSPGYTKNAIMYNKILHDWSHNIGATFIDEITFLHRNGEESIFGSDGYHLNITGHSIIAESIFNLLLVKKHKNNVH